MQQNWDNNLGIETMSFQSFDKTFELNLLDFKLDFKEKKHCFSNSKFHFMLGLTFQLLKQPVIP